MTDQELATIRHAHSLLNGLTAAEDGFMECIEEATEALQSLLPDDNNRLPENVVHLFSV